jgi:uncharacterized protein
MPTHHTDAYTAAMIQRQAVIPLAIIGMGAGLLSGLFGVGGGTVMVPAMVLTLAFDQHRAQATSLAAIVPIAIIGAVIFGAADSLDLPAAILLAVGSLVGVQVGARLMHRLTAEWLSRIFGVFLLIVAVIMLVK